MVALFGSNCSSSSMKGHSELYKLVSSVASEAMGIGRTADVLTVLGGKASCRRKFVLNVHLVDDQGNSVPHDLAIVASVAYAHDHSPVVRDEKPFLAEPPLFTTFNGVEFPAQDRPTRMVSGRASFKLAISLLSSKCDNRLFCICFTPQNNANSSDATSIYTPCYSKPIRSISRKRTQSSNHISPTPPLLLMGGLETPQLFENPIPSHKDEKQQKQQKQQQPQTEQQKEFRSMNYLLESNEGLNVLGFGMSSTVSDENDDESALSPTRRTHLQCSSWSSSATSMQYISPTSALAKRKPVDERYQCSGRGEGGARVGAGGEIVLHASDDTSQNPPQAINTTILTNISSDVLNVRGMENVHDTNPSRSSTSDSESPTSGGLTSESSYDNKQQQTDPVPAASIQCSPIGIGGPRTTLNSASAFSHLQVPSTRPFRPYAVVGPCKIPLDTCSTNFQLGNHDIPLASLSTQIVKKSTDGGGGDQNCTKTLLERMNQPREGEDAIPMEKLHQTVSGKMDSVLHSFSIGTEMRGGSNSFINHNYNLNHNHNTSSDEEKLNSSGLTDISLEEEEKSLHYIEVSIQEVSKEVQRRREELRSKRRRLLEDEARMHSIVFQSSSWIENLSGRFNL